MLPHAPGVQMADIPEDSVNLDKEVGRLFTFYVDKNQQFMDYYKKLDFKDEEVDAADPDKRGNMKLMDQGREADNEFEEGKSVSPISRYYLSFFV